MGIIEQIGIVASIAMPLWNIPLIVKIINRKSSEDISMAWVMGVWACTLLMAPAGFMSTDMAWRAFNITNLILFTGVVIVVFKYRKKTK
jgi:uncharacterized protein with PQ loop repeat